MDVVNFFCNLFISAACGSGALCAASFFAALYAGCKGDEDAHDLLTLVEYTGAFATIFALLMYLLLRIISELVLLSIGA